MPKTAEKPATETPVAETAKNLVERFREEGSVRLTEIREIIAPLVDEEAALAEMLGESVKFGEAKKAAAPAPAPASEGNGTPAPAAKPKVRRKREGGTRADQAVELIASQPGISASDVAKALKIKPNYLYRVLGDMEKEGRVRKDGRQYYPVS